MRITKVYTRTGDKGQTRLVGGQKVSKDDARIEAYGTIDELNTILGIVRMEIVRDGRDVGPLDMQLSAIQNDLFNLGSDLATRSEDRWEGMRLVDGNDVTRLEREIDAMNGPLPALKEFILPGGSAVPAFLHQARTVCRRAERRLQTLAGREDVNPEALVYVNRLSDWLFVAGRAAAAMLGEREVAWDRTR
jgi:cob(I)alamin adenosyltransferase